MVRLVCYNIEYCEGIDGLWYQYLMFWKVFMPPKGLDEQMVEALKQVNPDVLALVEVDTGSWRSKKDEVVFFERSLGMKNMVEKVKYPFDSWLKLFHYVPILNHQANAIVSRYKLHNIRYHLLHEGTKRVVIQADIHCPRKVTMVLAHLALGARTRAKQIEELIRIVNDIDNPVILMGDFNTYRGEQELDSLRRRTHLQDKKKLDRYSVHYTAPSWHPYRRLDYVLSSPDIKVHKYRVLNFPFSDHLPLFLEFDA